MNSPKTEELLELLEEVRKLDLLIEVHRSNPDPLMRQQYMDRQSDLLHALITSVLGDTQLSRVQQLVLVQMALRHQAAEAFQEMLDSSALGSDEAYAALRAAFG